MSEDKQLNFVNRVFEIFGDEITVLGEYKNARTKVLFRCNKCGNEYYQAPESTYRGYRGCRECNTPPSLHTHEQFLTLLPQVVLDNCNFLTEYVANKKPILCQCKKCGHERWILCNNLKKGYNCTKCGVSKRARTPEDYEREFYEQNPKFLLLTPFVSLNEKVAVKCKVCGKERAIKASSAIGKNKSLKCKLCTYRIPYYELENRLRKAHGDNYLILSHVGRQNRNDNFLVCHRKCGHIWKVRLSSMFAGCGCPKCRESKGEKRIGLWLKSNNMPYRTEIEFENLVGLGKTKRRLRFDFGIYSESGELKLLIEYDGELHYMNTNIHKNLERTQRHDQLKNDYCKNNNIKLIRIPYWDFDNIEKILELELS